MHITTILIMDYFCQSGSVNGSFPQSWGNTCHCDWINIIVTLFSTYLALLLIVCLRWIETRQESLTRSCTYNHNLRVICAVILFLTHWTETADAFLSRAQLHVFIIPFASLILLIIFLILEHIIERTNKISLFFLTGSLWLANGISRLFRLGTLLYIGVQLDRLRPFTAALSSAIYFFLSVSEFLVAKNEVERTSSEESGSDHFNNKVYRYDEVHLFSRATFYWINSLLKNGYKAPIELEDLGALPQAHSAEQVHQKLESAIYPVKGKMTPSSFWKFFLLFMKPDFLIGGIFKLLGDVIGIIGPLGISVMVTFVAEQKNQKDKHYEVYPSIGELWKNGWTIAFIVFFASIAQSTFSQASTHIVNVKSIHLKVALQSLMYKKSLRLRASACNLKHISKEPTIDNKLGGDNVDLGALVNLMSNDTTNIMSFFWIGHYIWAIPVKMALIMFFLYIKLGVSAIIGAAGTILVLMPLQLTIGKKMAQNTSVISELSDERLKHLSVFIDKIKPFKLLGWENYYSNKILKLRRKEMKVLDKVSIFWGVLTFLTHASSILVSVITFGMHYAFSDTTLTSESVFSTLALINQLMVPLFIFPVIIPTIVEAMVSCKRITEYFNLPEISVKCAVVEKNVNNKKEAGLKNFEMKAMMKSLHEENEIRIPQTSKNPDALKNVNQQTCYDCSNNVLSKDDGEDMSMSEKENISDDVDVSQINENTYSPEYGENTSDWMIMIEDGIFSWHPDSVQTRLFIKKLKIMEGDTVVIVGKVGSGKTSLLSAILGDMQLDSGTFTWSRKVSVAYCPQTPWFFNGTIRDNILFGLPFRPRRYDQVLDACALKSDLSILPKKDLTEIGEQGFSLSGGQKQRIAIARTLYSRADLVILDDALSSLDLTMAATIFEEGIRRLVKKCKKTVIMVTHNLQFTADCHWVIAMESGEIKAQGKPNDIKHLVYELFKTWKDPSLISDNSALKERGARERWQLIKSVARIRRSLLTKDMENSSWLTEDNIRAYLSVGKHRTLFDKYSEWNYITHDLPLPNDDFHRVRNFDLSRRRNSVKKRGIGRASSLQDRHTKTLQVVRQYSSPLSADTNKDYRPQKNNRKEFINQFINPLIKTHGTENGDFKKSITRAGSSDSGMSDLFSESTDTDFEVTENFLIKDVEEREYGKMKKNVYATYLAACGVKTAVAYLTITSMWQIVRVITDFWLSIWNETSENEKVLNSLYIYALLSVTSVILSLLSHALGQYAGSQARKKLHDLMLLSVVQCPNKVFECTPAGRIFNRFSSDIEIVDKKLATTIQRLMQFLLFCCSSIVINAIITPWFIVISIPVIVLYYIIQMFYRCSSRELQRIDSITRSPIYSHFAETLSGLTSIKAFSYEDKFISSFYTKLNHNTNCFLILNSTNRWLGIVLDYLGGLIVFLAMMTALTALEFYPSSVTPSLVGLAMNYILLVPVYLNWVVKFFVDCETYLGAVERIKQYTTVLNDNVNQQTAFDVIPPNGLSLGDIKFENVTLSYESSKEPALIGINLHIPPGQKVGICGRSGSGKSTLALSLFNMLDIQGVIKIDDFDITKIPHNVLRSSGSIIPQDALLFNGTIRENLDASGLSTDEELWFAIEQANLREVINIHYHGNLDSEFNGGKFLSSGQKQLFSLARAILRKSSFLIMDEATSNLDKESEQILMSTAQNFFKGKTLLIIAHRLSTVLDCNRIIVLERGRIVEDGMPSYLLNKKEGIFSAMVKSSEEGFLIP